jgi:hypothetical protein
MQIDVLNFVVLFPRSQRSFVQLFLDLHSAAHKANPTDDRTILEGSGTADANPAAANP